MGSVKDLETETQPTPNQLGEGLFKFTDSYSIFDWGRMPDRIDDKGRSLCTMGAFNFELLESEDIPTHYRGVVEDGEIKELDDATQPPKEMAIYLAHKPDLPYEDGSYDYQAFHRETGDTYLIPLEVVFRNSIPPESSFRNRKTPGDIGLNIDRWPDGNCELPNPVVEYSTKLEDKDRYLTIDEARKISGLGDELEKVRKVADRVNQVVTEYAQESGFIHVDGKIECVYHKGDVLVADVVGTFDENRFMYPSDTDEPERKQISKEYLRKFYRSYDQQWIERVERAKRQANERNVEDWRSLCDIEPKPLPSDVAVTASNMYTSGTNLYTGKEWFNSPHLEEVIEKI